MTSSYTTNKSIEKPANGDYVNTWSTPVNNDWDIIDKAFGGRTSLNVVSVSGVVSLTASQYQAPIILISGTLTANVNYQIPSGVGGFWFIYNNTSGAFTVTFSNAAGGTSVVLAQGYTTAVISDGTNIGLADTNISQAAGGNAQIQVNISGALGGYTTFVFDGTKLGVGTASPGSTVDVAGTINVTGAMTSGDLANALGYKGMPQNAQTGAYTLALSDMGKHISITTGGVVIPANSSVAFPIGATVVVYNDSAATQAISITSDTLRLAGTATTGTRTLAQRGLVTLVKVKSTEWVSTGNVT